MHDEYIKKRDDNDELNEKRHREDDVQTRVEDIET